MSEGGENYRESPRRSKRLRMTTGNARARVDSTKSKLPSKIKSTRHRKRLNSETDLVGKEKQEEPRRYNLRRQSLRRSREHDSSDQNQKDDGESLKLNPISSFTAGIADPYDPCTKRRFVDVAFLDDDHLLCLEGSYFGFADHSKILCFTMEGNLLSELPLPDYPTRICVLSALEVIVSIKHHDEEVETGGLTWLSVESETKNMRQTKHVAMKTHPLGFLIVKNNIVVTHRRSTFMTVLDMEGNFIRIITVAYGSPWRGLYLEEQDVILWLYCEESKIRAINLDGEELFSADGGFSPAAIVRDRQGNIYIGGVHMCICQYKMSENHLVLVHKLDSCLGLALNKESDLLAVAHKHSISFFRV